jgi:dihydrodipicolinate synthase/N-acetylneuraminate lyase
VKNGNRLRGIIVALYTPTNVQGGIDIPGLRRLVRYMIDGGIHGIFTMGSMGGCVFYHREEKLMALEAVLEEAKGQRPVLFGIVENGTKEAMRYAREAEKLGADALVFTPPGYFGYSERHVVSYFRDLAQATSLPVYIYNRLDNRLTHKMIEELRKEDNIVGLKDSSCDFSYFLSLLDEFGGSEDFAIFQGDETVIAQSLISGADGAIVGTANIAPRLVLDIYNSVVSGDTSQAIKAQRRWTELWKVNGDADLFAGQAAALELLGICERYVQPPMEPATRAQVEVIKARMEKAKIL